MNCTFCYFIKPVIMVGEGRFRWRNTWSCLREVCCDLWYYIADSFTFQLLGFWKFYLLESLWLIHCKGLGWIVTNKRNIYVKKTYFSNYYPNFLSLMCVMFLCVWNLYKYSKHFTHVDENNIWVHFMKGEDAHTTCWIMFLTTLS